MRQRCSSTIKLSKLHIIDLAGSERVAKTNLDGTLLTEAKYMNTSLFYLELVITALYEKATKGRQHIPYRNSFMTSVLRFDLYQHYVLTGKGGNDILSNCLIAYSSTRISPCLTVIVV